MNRHRQALTLIELVATVSAFALVAALLAPALADVSRRGKDTVCLQNLARIAEASIVYAAEDPDGQAVPVHPKMDDATMPEGLRRATPVYAWGGKSGCGTEGYDSLFWGTGRDKGPVTRPLNKILYGDVFPDYRMNPGPGFSNWKSDEQLDLSIYRCPSDNGYTGIHYDAWEASGLTSFDHYGTSYATSVLWIYTSCGYYCASNSVFFHRLCDIVNPSNTVYYQENCGRYTFQANPQPPDCGGGQEGVVHGWHGQPWLFNTAFVDGHAARTRMRGYRNPDLGHYPGGEYYFWRCVIIRGDDWQMDTLPLEPLATTIPCGGDRDDSPPQQGGCAPGARRCVPDVR